MERAIQQLAKDLRQTRQELTRKIDTTKNKIDEFIRKKLKRLEGVYPDLFPILITHMISSADVADYAEGQGIHLYYSYQFG